MVFSGGTPSDQLQAKPATSPSTNPNDSVLDDLESPPQENEVSKQDQKGVGSVRKFSAYFWQHTLVAALVIFFEFYSTAASVALGMLMCVKVPAKKAPLYRWVMDVRLQCPVDTSCFQPWVGWAWFIGMILLLFCIWWPLYIAAKLLQQASAGRLCTGAEGTSSTQQNPSVPFSELLAFRYADYDVDYRALQRRLEHLKPGHWLEFWSAVCRLPVRKCLVLVWDSVLDLQRFVLALLALCVMLDELHQLLLMTVVFSLYLLAIVAIRPWRSTTVWLLQVAAASVLVLSCCTIMAAQIGDSSSHYTREDKQQFAVLLPALVIAMNAAYILGGLLLLTQRIWGKFGSQLAGFVKERLRKLGVLINAP